MKKKELLIILILAVLVSAFVGYISDFPLQFTEPVLCIQMIGARCPPKINLTNMFLDFLFWFFILTGSWGVAKWVRR